MELLATTILDVTYHRVDIDEVINNQKHLTKNNEGNFAKSLSNSKNYLMEQLVIIHTERST